MSFSFNFDIRETPQYISGQQYFCTKLKLRLILNKPTFIFKRSIARFIYLFVCLFIHFVLILKETLCLNRTHPIIPAIHDLPNLNAWQIYTTIYPSLKSCFRLQVRATGVIGSEIVAGVQRATLSLIWSIILQFQVFLCTCLISISFSAVPTFPKFFVALKKVSLSLHRSRVANQAGAYPGFCRIERVGASLPPPG